MTIRQRFYICLLLLGCVILDGSAGFHFIESWSWFDVLGLD
jgi:hypothetical protein